MGMAGRTMSSTCQSQDFAGGSLMFFAEMDLECNDSSLGIQVPSQKVLGPSKPT